MTYAPSGDIVLAGDAGSSYGGCEDPDNIRSDVHFFSVVKGEHLQSQFDPIVVQFLSNPFPSFHLDAPLAASRSCRSANR